MAVDWGVYIAAVVQDIAKNLQSENVFTRKVSAKRMKLAEVLLPKLKFSSKLPLYVLGNRALAFLEDGETTHAVIFIASTASEQTEPILKAAQALNLDIQKVDSTDSHFLFLAKNISLSVLPERKEGLNLFLESTPKDSSITIDFDRACDAYGSVFAWVVNDQTQLGQFLDLLSAESPELSRILFTESTIFCENLANSVSEKKVVNLSKLWQALTAPISLVLDGNVNLEGVFMEPMGGMPLEIEDIEVSLQEVAFNVGGGACFRFTQENKNFLAISVRGLPEWERVEVVNLLTQYGAIEEQFTDAHLLAFLNQLEGSVQFSTLVMADERLFDDKIVMDEKKCISFVQIKSLYEELQIFDVSNSVEVEPLRILSRLAVKFIRARSTFIPLSLVQVAERLVNIPQIPYENIYLSLSASHWKHSFLEAYRMVEGLYYFSWMHKLKLALGSSLSEYELSIECQSTMSWAYTEKNSIKELFSLVPRTILTLAAPESILCVEKRLSGKNVDIEFMRSFAASIYSIRNANIHQGEVDSAEFIEVTASCWPRLTLSLFLIIEFFYSKHISGVPRSGKAKKTILSFES